MSKTVETFTLYGPKRSDPISIDEGNSINFIRSVNYIDNPNNTAYAIYDFSEK